ncbi:MAG TPA: hypothetical protein VFV33_00135 [Gemmatimonadaceae bacterium]|nr:hypothetical protein [Gemmatimonadaceae bacterium]
MLPARLSVLRAAALLVAFAAPALPAQSAGASAGSQGGGAPRPRPWADVLITGGAVITMDAQRRVLDDGAIAIVGDRIVAVGPTPEVTARYRGRQVIDARDKIVMPGLIDGHGHAGHALTKSLGADNDQWYPAVEKIYARASSLGFWRAEAYLAGLERLRFGVTTSLSFLGGGEMIMRTDDPAYGDAYLQAIDRLGLRFFLAVGPRRGPYPNTYVQWTGDTPREVPVSFERHLEVSEALIRK